MLGKRRRKHSLPIVDVNVVPLMDILTTMLFFLVVMAGLSKFSVLFGGSDLPGIAEEQDKKPKFAMELTIPDNKQMTIRIGALNGIKVIQKDRLLKHLDEKFSGSENSGFSKTIQAWSLKKMLSVLQTHLVKIKQSFPHEVRVSLIVSDKVDYQDIISVIAAVRGLPGEVDAFSVETFLGKTKNIKELFPDVIIRETGG